MDGSRFTWLSSIFVLARSHCCLREKPLVFSHTKNFCREIRAKRYPISKFLFTFALAIDCHTLPSAARGDQRPKLNQTTHGSPWRRLSFPRVHLLTKTWKKKNFEKLDHRHPPVGVAASVMPILIMWPTSTARAMAEARTRHRSTGSTPYSASRCSPSSTRAATW